MSATSMVIDLPAVRSARKPRSIPRQRAHRSAGRPAGRTPAAAAARPLLAQAGRGLVEAAWEREPNQRFAAAYLSALRAAAAVLAMRGRPHRGRSRPTSVWTLLPKLAPELTEWAMFFAANSPTHAAIQAGISRTVTARAADDLLRQAGQFLDLVRRQVDTSVRSRP